MMDVGVVSFADRDYSSSPCKRRRTCQDAPISVSSETSANVQDGDNDNINSAVDKKTENQNIIVTREYSRRHPEAIPKKTSRSSIGKRKQEFASCHRCKTSKSIIVMMFCTRQYPYLQTQGGYTCRKKYCIKCLQTQLCNFTDEERNKWTCPACLGVCACSKCVREKAAELKSSWPSLPMTMVTRSSSMFSALSLGYIDNDTSYSSSSSPLCILPFPTGLEQQDQNTYYVHPPLSPLSSSSTLPLSISESQNTLPFLFDSHSSLSVSDSLPLLNPSSEPRFDNVNTLTCLELFPEFLRTSNETLPGLETDSIDAAAAAADDAVQTEQKQEIHSTKIPTSTKYKIVSACINCRLCRIRCEATR